MKVVLNRCYGGFGLSRACFIKLFKRRAGIIKGTPFRKAMGSVLAPEGKDWPSKEYEKAEEADWYSKKGIGTMLSDCGVYAPPGREPTYYSTSSDYQNRTDPDLIALIKEFGSEWASGRFAKLETVEIPDDIQWEIQEYDGTEHIAEKHRTW